MKGLERVGKESEIPCFSRLSQWKDLALDTQVYGFTTCHFSNDSSVGGFRFMTLIGAIISSS